MSTSRRNFLKLTATVAACAFAPSRSRANETILGAGEFRYRLVPGWGVLGADTPVNNCHGLARDREGHIILLTDEVRNNVIVYDKKGAHGLSLVTECAREVLVDDEGSLYVAQYASGKTYPLKFERV